VNFPNMPERNERDDEHPQEKERDLYRYLPHGTPVNVGNHVAKMSAVESEPNIIPRIAINRRRVSGSDRSFSVPPPQALHSEKATHTQNTDRTSAATETTWFHVWSIA
jgi:hypothetical protein